MKQTLEWYDDFQYEIGMIEKNSVCPVCGSHYIFNTNPYGYDFMCGCCSSTFALHGKYDNELLAITTEH